jgi:ribonuclease HII
MILAHSQFEQKYWSEGKEHIVGIDEVGRGCWAGPLVIGAVIFPKNTQLTYTLADSKLLPEKKRNELADKIKKSSLGYTIREIPLEIINEKGIGYATQYGYREAIQEIIPSPDFILIDAFTVKEYPKEKQLPIIKGDQQSISIAAASIIAKVYRDELMRKLHSEMPYYGFSTNVGYGTKTHQKAIAQYGLSQYHRLSFNLQRWMS